MLSFVRVSCDLIAAFAAWHVTISLCTQNIALNFNQLMLAILIELEQYLPSDGHVGPGLAIPLGQAGTGQLARSESSKMCAEAAGPRCSASFLAGEIRIFFYTVSAQQLESTGTEKVHSLELDFS